jgi:ankyrin repeat protein
MTGKVALMVYLKNCGLPFDEQDEAGRTPLHLSILEGETSSALCLTAWTSDINLKDKEGRTALHYSAMSDSYRVSRHLLLKGADKSLKDNQGQTAEDLSNLKGSSDIKALLVTPT